MRKISSKFIINQYNSGLTNYIRLTTEIGLWESEKYVFNKYLNSSDQILDVGCGAGRTTFALYKMGFQQIIGIDLTPAMIDAASKLNHHFGTDISFRVEDACDLTFEETIFDVVIFSFNGLMSIPSLKARSKALMEINRVLKPGGAFILTTHDRTQDQQYLEFWAKEKVRWELGKRDDRLYEYGDLITSSKNESRQIFIHIPSPEEIKKWVSNHGFSVLETFYRNDLFVENFAVQESSGECRFWVLKKESNSATSNKSV